jgi:N6-L-threonylcarbamoyladenine synthase
LKSPASCSAKPPARDAGTPAYEKGAGAARRILLRNPYILAIETSCDETAAAVIAGDGTLLANVIASQVDFHHRFGGVVPEIASRKHTEAIAAVVEQALWEANTPLAALDAIAVTYAPGLIGALVVGVAYAKGLSWAASLPLIFVNHLEGHIYANKLTTGLPPAPPASPAPTATSARAEWRAERKEQKAKTGEPKAQPDAGGGNRAELLPKDADEQPLPHSLRPPFVVALLSGGTTMLVNVRDWGDYRIMGRTLDDAVGEAFDKVAKALGLGYPGGPAIARLAEKGDPAAIDFPRVLLNSHGYDFSLSGLKTAVITWIRQQLADDAAAALNLCDIAASFQQAVIDVQAAKALAACQEADVSSFCIGGGVAANRALRAAYEQTLSSHGIQVFYPPAIACTDNAAMIALVALDRYAQGRFATLASDAQANASLEEPY